MSKDKKYSYQLRFVSSMDPSRSYTFPCNEKGEVDKSLMSRTLLKNYERVLKEVGKNFLFPIINKI